MTNATTLKAISLATVIAVTASFSSTAFAHPSSVSKDNAINLVKALLKSEYNGDRYSARATRKIGDSWVVTIKDRTRTVATASVDAKTGNIHVE